MLKAKTVKKLKIVLDRSNFTTKLKQTIRDFYHTEQSALSQISPVLPAKSATHPRILSAKTTP